MKDLVGAAYLVLVGALVVPAYYFAFSYPVPGADPYGDGDHRGVVGRCRKRAEEIMDQGRSKHYAEAITWLEEVRDAYLLDGREEAWREYLDELIECHQRKYKLRPMLEDLAR